MLSAKAKNTALVGVRHLDKEGLSQPAGQGIDINIAGN
tara:strand:+ start:691 stop:804 length:114 start_codon:yes stop_codon:yes gene_type:complete